ncbi:venom acid phosphatase Acph-1-like [Venturia canescens]|uniref:venom acid phosphatase Acph-1-like n=1 Tax=Venturia canescens TaxID=32260 RepID=UPI001C9C60BF|nr:venom acid phosphatase Acph-1-like [Venturia canescens]XP_043271982.1 venom acid phosphatase Acph-1-like [Venturia canescens]XP_043271984.1 venom acid phosphatase Acph-1-like [Venturia canescens]XP_043271985.1 venom acid phosphatase Acph-1-like [Venturia canescens]
MSTILYRAFAVLVIFSSAKADSWRQEELRFVTVVFRHGDRAPDNNGKELYPNDPYLNYNFYPMGLGGLTNNGKMREYVLGEQLRHRYNNFLGSVYLPKDIVARSTDYARTKMSLSLVLASLYPPDGLQRWNFWLRWQPIPITYVPDALDVLLIPEECPQYLEELNRVVKLPEVMERVKKFRPLMKNLTILTGKKIENTNQMYYLYHDLMAEKSMGLKLPKWTEPLFPFGPLWNATILEYDITNYNDLLKRLNGGMLLRRISDDIVAAIKNETKPARKMNIFSGHETNIAALLKTLGVYEPHVPEYSSAVIVELFQRGDQYYVQVLYYLGIPATIKIMTVPGCQQLCPIDDFFELLDKVIPTDDELYCPK